MKDLPSEVRQNINLYLPLGDVVRQRSVNRFSRNIVDDQLFWARKAMLQLSCSMTDFLQPTDDRLIELSHPQRYRLILLRKLIQTVIDGDSETYRRLAALNEVPLTFDYWNARAQREFKCGLPRKVTTLLGNSKPKPPGRVDCPLLDYLQLQMKRLNVALVVDDDDTIRRILQSKEFNPTINYGEPLSAAVCYGNPEAVRLLLKNPLTNINTCYGRLVTDAIELLSTGGYLEQRLEIVRLLLGDPRLQISIENNCILKYAVGRANIGGDPLEGDFWPAGDFWPSLIKMIIHHPNFTPSRLSGIRVWYNIVNSGIPAEINFLNYRSAEILLLLKERGLIVDQLRILLDNWNAAVGARVDSRSTENFAL